MDDLSRNLTSSYLRDVQEVADHADNMRQQGLPVMSEIALPNVGVRWGERSGEDDLLSYWEQNQDQLFDYNKPGAEKEWERIVAAHSNRMTDWFGSFGEAAKSIAGLPLDLVEGLIESRNPAKWVASTGEGVGRMGRDMYGLFIHSSNPTSPLFWAKSHIQALLEGRPSKNWKEEAEQWNQTRTYLYHSARVQAGDDSVFKYYLNLSDESNERVKQFVNPKIAHAMAFLGLELPAIGEALFAARAGRAASAVGLTTPLAAAEMAAKESAGIMSHFGNVATKLEQFSKGVARLGVGGVAKGIGKALEVPANLVGRATEGAEGLSAATGIPRNAVISSAVDGAEVILGDQIRQTTGFFGSFGIRSASEFASALGDELINAGMGIRKIDDIQGLTTLERLAAKKTLSPNAQRLARFSSTIIDPVIATSTEALKRGYRNAVEFGLLGYLNDRGKGAASGAGMGFMWGGYSGAVRSMWSRVNGVMSHELIKEDFDKAMPELAKVHPAAAEAFMRATAAVDAFGSTMASANIRTALTNVILASGRDFKNVPVWAPRTIDELTGYILRDKFGGNKDYLEIAKDEANELFNGSYGAFITPRGNLKNGALFFNLHIGRGVDAIHEATSHFLFHVLTEKHEIGSVHRQFLNLIKSSPENRAMVVDFAARLYAYYEAQRLAGTSPEFAKLKTREEMRAWIEKTAKLHYDRPETLAPLEDVFGRPTNQPKFGKNGLVPLDKTKPAGPDNAEMHPIIHGGRAYFEAALKHIDEFVAQSSPDVVEHGKLPDVANAFNKSVYDPLNFKKIAPQLYGRAFRFMFEEAIANRAEAHGINENLAFYSMNPAFRPFRLFAETYRHQRFSRMLTAQEMAGIRLKAGGEFTHVTADGRIEDIGKLYAYEGGEYRVWEGMDEIYRKTLQTARSLDSLDLTIMNPEVAAVEAAKFGKEFLFNFGRSGATLKGTRQLNDESAKRAEEILKDIESNQDPRTKLDVSYDEVGNATVDLMNASDAALDRLSKFIDPETMRTLKEFRDSQKAWVDSGFSTPNVLEGFLWGLTQRRGGFLGRLRGDEVGVTHRLFVPFEVKLIHRKTDANGQPLSKPRGGLTATVMDYKANAKNMLEMWKRPDVRALFTTFEDYNKFYHKYLINQMQPSTVRVPSVDLLRPDFGSRAEEVRNVLHETFGARKRNDEAYANPPREGYRSNPESPNYPIHSMRLEQLVGTRLTAFSPFPYHHQHSYEPLRLNKSVAGFTRDSQQFERYSDRLGYTVLRSGNNYNSYDPFGNKLGTFESLKRAITAAKRNSKKLAPADIFPEAHDVTSMAATGEVASLPKVNPTISEMLQGNFEGTVMKSISAVDRKTGEEIKHEFEWSVASFKPSAQGLSLRLGEMLTKGNRDKLKDFCKRAGLTDFSEIPVYDVDTQVGRLTGSGISSAPRNVGTFKGMGETTGELIRLQPNGEGEAGFSLVADRDYIEKMEDVHGPETILKTIDSLISAHLELQAIGRATDGKAASGHSSMMELAQYPFGKNNFTNLRPNLLEDQIPLFQALLTGRGQQQLMFAHPDGRTSLHKDSPEWEVREGFRQLRARIKSEIDGLQDGSKKSKIKNVLHYSSHDAAVDALLKVQELADISEKNLKVLNYPVPSKGSKGGKETASWAHVHIDPSSPEYIKSLRLCDEIDQIFQKNPDVFDQLEKSDLKILHGVAQTVWHSAQLFKPDGFNVQKVLGQARDGHLWFDPDGKGNLRIFQLYNQRSKAPLYVFVREAPEDIPGFGDSISLGVIVASDRGLDFKRAKEGEVNNPLAKAALRSMSEGRGPQQFGDGVEPGLLLTGTGTIDQAGNVQGALPASAVQSVLINAALGRLPSVQAIHSGGILLAVNAMARADLGNAWGDFEPALLEAIKNGKESDRWQIVQAMRDEIIKSNHQALLPLMFALFKAEICRGACAETAKLIEQRMNVTLQKVNDQNVGGKERRWASDPQGTISQDYTPQKFQDRYMLEAQSDVYDSLQILLGTAINDANGTPLLLSKTDRGMVLGHVDAKRLADLALRTADGSPAKWVGSLYKDMADRGVPMRSDIQPTTMRSVASIRVLDPVRREELERAGLVRRVFIGGKYVTLFEFPDKDARLVTDYVGGSMLMVPFAGIPEADRQAFADKMAEVVAKMADPRVLSQQDGLELPEIELGKIFDHPLLFKYYPELRKMPVEFAPSMHSAFRVFGSELPNLHTNEVPNCRLTIGMLGALFAMNEADGVVGGVRSIFESNDPRANPIISSILHEIQHYIQYREGFNDNHQGYLRDMPEINKLMYFANILGIKGSFVSEASHGSAVGGANVVMWKYAAMMQAAGVDANAAKKTFKPSGLELTDAAAIDVMTSAATSPLFTSLEGYIKPLLKVNTDRMSVYGRIMKDAIEREEQNNPSLATDADHLSRKEFAEKLIALPEKLKLCVTSDDMKAIAYESGNYRTQLAKAVYDYPGLNAFRTDSEVQATGASFALMHELSVLSDMASEKKDMRTLFNQVNAAFRQYDYLEYLLQQDELTAREVQMRANMSEADMMAKPMEHLGGFRFASTLDIIKQALDQDISNVSEVRDFPKGDASATSEETYSRAPIMRSIAGLRKSPYDLDSAETLGRIALIKFVGFHATNELKALGRYMVHGKGWEVGDDGKLVLKNVQYVMKGDLGKFPKSKTGSYVNESQGRTYTINELAQLADAVIMSEDVTSVRNGVIDLISSLDFPDIVESKEVVAELNKVGIFSPEAAEACGLNEFLDAIGPDALITKNDLLNTLCFLHKDYGKSIQAFGSRFEGASNVEPNTLMGLSREEKVRVLTSTQAGQEQIDLHTRHLGLDIKGIKFNIGMFAMDGSQIYFNPSNANWSNLGVTEGDMNGIKSRIESSPVFRALRKRFISHGEAQDQLANLNARLGRKLILMQPVLESVTNGLAKKLETGELDPSGVRQLALSILTQVEQDAIQTAAVMHDFLSNDDQLRVGSIAFRGDQHTMGSNTEKSALERLGTDSPQELGMNVIGGLTETYGGVPLHGHGIFKVAPLRVRFGGMVANFEKVNGGSVYLSSESVFPRTTTATKISSKAPNYLPNPDPFVPLQSGRPFGDATDTPHVQELSPAQWIRDVEGAPSQRTIRTSTDVTGAAFLGSHFNNHPAFNAHQFQIQMQEMYRDYHDAIIRRIADLDLELQRRSGVEVNFNDNGEFGKNLAQYSAEQIAEFRASLEGSAKRISSGEMHMAAVQRVLDNRSNAITVATGAFGQRNKGLYGMVPASATYSLRLRDGNTLIVPSMLTAEPLNVNNITLFGPAIGTGISPMLRRAHIMNKSAVDQTCMAHTTAHMSLSNGDNIGVMDRAGVIAGAIKACTEAIGAPISLATFPGEFSPKNIIGGLAGGSILHTFSGLLSAHDASAPRGASLIDFIQGNAPFKDAVTSAVASPENQIGIAVNPDLPGHFTPEGHVSHEALGAIMAPFIVAHNQGGFMTVLEGSKIKTVPIPFVNDAIRAIKDTEFGSYGEFLSSLDGEQHKAHVASLAASITPALADSIAMEICSSGCSTAALTLQGAIRLLSRVELEDSDQSGGFMRAHRGMKTKDAINILVSRGEHLNVAGHESTGESAKVGIPESSLKAYRAQVVNALTSERFWHGFYSSVFSMKDAPTYALRKNNNYYDTSGPFYTRLGPDSTRGSARITVILPDRNSESQGHGNSHQYMHMPHGLEEDDSHGPLNQNTSFTVMSPQQIPDRVSLGGRKARGGDPLASSSGGNNGFSVDDPNRNGSTTMLNQLTQLGEHFSSNDVGDTGAGSGRNLKIDIPARPDAVSMSVRRQFLIKQMASAAKNLGSEMVASQGARWQSVNVPSPMAIGSEPSDRFNFARDALYRNLGLSGWGGQTGYAGPNEANRVGFSWKRLPTGELMLNFSPSIDIPMASDMALGQPRAIHGVPIRRAVGWDHSSGQLIPAPVGMGLFFASRMSAKNTPIGTSLHALHQLNDSILSQHEDALRAMSKSVRISSGRKPLHENPSDAGVSSINSLEKLAGAQAEEIKTVFKRIMDGQPTLTLDKNYLDYAGREISGSIGTPISTVDSMMYFASHHMPSYITVILPKDHTIDHLHTAIFTHAAGSRYGRTVFHNGSPFESLNANFRYGQAPTIGNISPNVIGASNAIMLKQDATQTQTTVSHNTAYSVGGSDEGQSFAQIVEPMAREIMRQNPSLLADLDTLHGRIKSSDSGYFIPDVERQIMVNGDRSAIIQAMMPGREDLLRYAWDNKRRLSLDVFKRSDGLWNVAYNDAGGSRDTGQATPRRMVQSFRDESAAKAFAEKISLGASDAEIIKAIGQFGDAHWPAIVQTSEVGNLDANLLPELRMSVEDGNLYGHTGRWIVGNYDTAFDSRKEALAFSNLVNRAEVVTGKAPAQQPIVLRSVAAVGLLDKADPQALEYTLRRQINFGNMASPIEYSSRIMRAIVSGVDKHRRSKDVMTGDEWAAYFEHNAISKPELRVTGVMDMLFLNKDVPMSRKELASYVYATYPRMGRDRYFHMSSSTVGKRWPLFSSPSLAMAKRAELIMDSINEAIAGLREIASDPDDNGVHAAMLDRYRAGIEMSFRGAMEATMGKSLTEDILSKAEDQSFPAVEMLTKLSKTGSVLNGTEHSMFSASLLQLFIKNMNESLSGLIGANTIFAAHKLRIPDIMMLSTGDNMYKITGIDNPMGRLQSLPGIEQSLTHAITSARQIAYPDTTPASELYAGTDATSVMLRDQILHGYRAMATDSGQGVYNGYANGTGPYTMDVLYAGITGAGNMEHSLALMKELEKSIEAANRAGDEASAKKFGNMKTALGVVMTIRQNINGNFNLTSGHKGTPPGTIQLGHLRQSSAIVTSMVPTGATPAEMVEAYSGMTNITGIPVNFVEEIQSDIYQRHEFGFRQRYALSSTMKEAGAQSLFIQKGALEQQLADALKSSEVLMKDVRNVACSDYSWFRRTGMFVVSPAIVSMFEKLNYAERYVMMKNMNDRQAATIFKETGKTMQVSADVSERYGVPKEIPVIDIAPNFVRENGWSRLGSRMRQFEENINARTHESAQRAMNTLYPGVAVKGGRTLPFFESVDASELLGLDLNQGSYLGLGSKITRTMFIGMLHDEQFAKQAVIHTAMHPTVNALNFGDVHFKGFDFDAMARRIVEDLKLRSRIADSQGLETAKETRDFVDAIEQSSNAEGKSYHIPITFPGERVTSTDGNSLMYSDSPHLNRNPAKLIKINPQQAQRLKFIYHMRPDSASSDVSGRNISLTYPELFKVLYLRGRSSPSVSELDFAVDYVGEAFRGQRNTFFNNGEPTEMGKALVSLFEGKYANTPEELAAFRDTLLKFTDGDSGRWNNLTQRAGLHRLDSDMDPSSWSSPVDSAIPVVDHMAKTIGGRILEGLARGVAMSMASHESRKQFVPIKEQLDATIKKIEESGLKVQNEEDVENLVPDTVPLGESNAYRPYSIVTEVMRAMEQGQRGLTFADARYHRDRYGQEPESEGYSHNFVNLGGVYVPIDKCDYAMPYALSYAQSAGSHGRFLEMIGSQAGLPILQNNVERPNSTFEHNGVKASLAEHIAIAVSEAFNDINLVQKDEHSGRDGVRGTAFSALATRIRGSVKAATSTGLFGKNLGDVKSYKEALAHSFGGAPDGVYERAFKMNSAPVRSLMLRTVSGNHYGYLVNYGLPHHVNQVGMGGFSADAILRNSHDAYQSPVVELKDGKYYIVDAKTGKLLIGGIESISELRERRAQLSKYLGMVPVVTNFHKFFAKAGGYAMDSMMLGHGVGNPYTAHLELLLQNNRIAQLPIVNAMGEAVSANADPVSAMRKVMAASGVVGFEGINRTNPLGINEFARDLFTAGGQTVTGPINPFGTKGNPHLGYMKNSSFDNYTLHAMGIRGNSPPEEVAAAILKLTAMSSPILIFKPNHPTAQHVAEMNKLIVDGIPFMSIAGIRDKGAMVQKAVSLSNNFRNPYIMPTAPNGAGQDDE